MNNKEVQQNPTESFYVTGSNESAWELLSSKFFMASGGSRVLAPGREELPFVSNGLYGIISRSRKKIYGGSSSLGTVRLYVFVKEGLTKQLIRNAISSFRKRIRKIDGAVQIAYASSGNTVTIWTFLKKLERKSLYQLYNEEQRLVEEYPTLVFEFTALLSGDKHIPSNFALEQL